MEELSETTKKKGYKWLARRAGNSRKGKRGGAGESRRMGRKGGSDGGGVHEAQEGAW